MGLVAADLSGEGQDGLRGEGMGGEGEAEGRLEGGKSETMVMALFGGIDEEDLLIVGNQVGIFNLKLVSPGDFTGEKAVFFEGIGESPAEAVILAGIVADGEQEGLHQRIFS